jgi:hypothetical protein
VNRECEDKRAIDNVRPDARESEYVTVEDVDDSDDESDTPIVDPIEKPVECKPSKNDGAWKGTLRPEPKKKVSYALRAR